MSQWDITSVNHSLGLRDAGIYRSSRHVISKLAGNQLYPTKALTLQASSGTSLARLQTEASRREEYSRIGMSFSLVLGEMSVEAVLQIDATKSVFSVRPEHRPHVLMLISQLARDLGPADLASNFHRYAGRILESKPE